MLSYLLEVGICWTLFYVLYYFLLRHETFFQLNRGFLLATLFLGLLIPLFDVPVLTSPLASTAITNYLEPVTVTVKSLEYTLDTVVVTSGTTHAFDWFSLLLIFYFVGVFIFGFRFLLGLNKIRQLYRRSEVEARTEYSLVKSSETHAPFSFFKLLFWSKQIELTEQEEKNILRHELAHIREKHSFDIIAVELLRVFFWWIPPVHFYKNALRDVHEYLADAAVYHTTPKKQYGQLLLKQAQSGPALALAHHFFHSQLKQRIIMMTRNKSNPRSLVKYLGLLPLAAVLLLAFSTTNSSFLSDAETTLTTSRVSSADPFDKEKIKNQLGHILVQYDNKNTFQHHENIFNEFKKTYLDLLEQYPDNHNDIAQVAQELIDKVKAPIFLVDKKEGRMPVFNLAQHTNDEGEVFKVVDQMPMFPGCEDQSEEAMKSCSQKQLLTFIFSNIKYPEEAKDQGIEGTVVVRFVVDKEGQIQEPEILRGIGGGCDEEVLRVVGTMPKWMPGKMNDQAVNVQFNLPVKFTLDGAAKKNTPTEEVLKSADVMPRLPGCESEADEAARQQCSNTKLITFLSENLTYPADAKAAAIEGMVVLKFIIDQEGNPKQPEIVRSIGYGCDEEVLRVFKKLINEYHTWTPGKMADGKTVSVYYNLPVKFKLQDKDREAVSQPVKSLTLENFKAFPNPVQNQLSLRFAAKAAPIQITLTDITGKVITNIEEPDFSGQYEGTIETTAAAPGTLILTIRQADQTFVQKLLRTK